MTGGGRIDRAVVRHVAELARLEVGPDEEERLVEELSRIVEWAGQLPEADDPEAAPALRAEAGDGGVDLPDTLQAARGGSGAALPVPLGDAFLRNAPAVEDGHLRLPPIRRSGGAVGEAEDRETPPAGRDAGPGVPAPDDG